MTNLHDSTETSGIPRPTLVRSSSVPCASSRWFALGLLGVLEGAACSPPPAQAPAAPVEAPAEPQRSAWPQEPKPQSDSVVHAEFLTSAQAVKPKGKFLLAVRFDIEDGYRISWQNPGDVGKTTRVRFEVPEGFSVGPLQYPAPTRFELPGKLVNYGYERQTAIFAEVTAPDRVPDGRAYRFDVKADWLACKDDCASEELSAWFELASSAFATEPELPAELIAYHAAVPAPFADLQDGSLDWKGGRAHPLLTLKAAEVKWVDFFPGDGDQPKLVAVKPAGEELRLKFASGVSSTPMRGLAVAEVDGKAAFYDVSAPWPTD
jgi:DsbC/DsbD-like thiol-disulfide interchange protein